MTIENSNKITLSWRDIRDLLLFVPVIHITFCFIFLFFYALAHGQSIEAFYSTSDIIHVSFRDIAFGYLALLVVLALGISLGLKLRRPRNIGVELTDPNQDPLVRSLLLLLALLSASSIMLAFAYAAIWWKLNNEVPVSSVITLTGSLFFLGISVLEFKKPKNLIRMAYGIIAFPFLTVAYFGAGAAEQDKLLTYNDLVRRQPLCREYAIVRNIGDYFMAVSNTGIHALIDDECKGRFILHPAPAISSPKVATISHQAVLPPVQSRATAVPTIEAPRP